MGLGFNDFTAGDVLTAAQVDGYLMRQSLMVFASTSARDTALSGNLEEGMHCYTTDTNSIYLYTGAAWIPFHTPWTSFTPAWGNLTEGNGVNDGRYRYVGGDLLVRARINLGSSSSVTGDVNLTLPNSATAAGSVASYGPVFCSQSGTGTFDGVAEVASGATTVDLFSDNSAVDATNPFTWATGDRLSVQMLVQVS